MLNREGGGGEGGRMCARINCKSDHVYETLLPRYERSLTREREESRRRTGGQARGIVKILIASDRRSKSRFALRYVTLRYIALRYITLCYGSCSVTETIKLERERS